MTASAIELLAAARHAGLTLKPKGDRLSVIPASKLTPELASQLRAAKPQVLAILEAEAAGLHPSCGPWLHTAKQIMLGEFDGGDRSTLKSLWYGVRGIGQPACQAARLRLETLLGTKEARP